jgi:FeS assembly SUF system protein
MASQIVQLKPNHEANPATALPQDAALEQRIIAALRTVYDPELPVNIYDLGLIYDIRVAGDMQVEIDMTLTAPCCPVAGSLPGQVERTVRTQVPLDDVTVTLVWDPPWTEARISEEARLELNMF